MWRERRLRWLLAIFAVATSLVFTALPPALASAAGYGGTIRVNVSSTGAQADFEGGGGALSADGRYVAYHSAASNLVPTDTNGSPDVFVRDTATGRTRRASVSSTGAQANAASGGAIALSADGRYVTFNSSATNLVPADTNNETDVFVHDLVTGRTRRVSVGSTGAQANGYSSRSAISADGRYVTFDSPATNLVPADTNNETDVFVHDLVTGRTRRVSVSSTRAQGNSESSGAVISAHGRYIAFNSTATNLASADTNNDYDVFVRDMATGRTRRVSVSSTGAQGNGGSGGPVISSNGRYIAFGSNATDLVSTDTNNATDAFIKDMTTGRTRRVSVSSTGAQANYHSSLGGISANGRYIAFSTHANNLVPADTNDSGDVFVRDVQTGSTRRVSVNSAGVQGNGGSFAPSISADGRHVAFSSDATNLVAGDTNGFRDVFVRQLVI